MNVLFLNSAKSWGGNEKWTLAAAEGLAGRGHRVYIGCRSEIFRERAAPGLVTFVPIPFYNNWDPFTVCKTAAAVKRFAIDVVIPTRRREYFLGGLAARIFPDVAIAARLGIDRPIRGWRSRTAFCRLFDGVIVNAQKIVDVLSAEEKFDINICRVIPNGIRIPAPITDARRAELRHSLGLEDNNFAICGAGRLSPQKGFDMAIEAFSQLAPKAPQARLVIVGSGTDQAMLQQKAAASGFGERIIFVPFRNDLPDLLQAVDLFWLTSRSEGMPNVLLEAMAAGRTACAFDVAGVPEVITDGKDGSIVPFADVAGIFAKTLLLVNDGEKRRTMEKEARRTMEAGFAVEKMVANTERFLAELARRG